MNKFNPLRYFRLKSGSLFLRLVAGFLCIIMLLAGVTMYAVSESQKSVRQEIVKYNTLMLRNTMENYENHFDIIKSQMYLFYYTDRVQQLQRAPQYSDFPAIISDILTWVSDPNLFIDNIVFYSKSNQFVIEKGTSTKPDTMFDYFLTSDRYSRAFWDRQFEESYTNRILPADTFYMSVYQGRQDSVGEYIPIVFKQSANQDFYMIVFLNAKKMFAAYHQTSTEDLVVYSNQGELLYNRIASSSYPSVDKLLKDGENEFIKDGHYYFHMRANDSGMTYLHRLPAAELASQARMNATMIAVILAVLVISVMIAFLLATKINNPFQRLVESIRGTGDEEIYRSSIQEFDMIGNQLRDKQRLTRQWAFINHLKDIRNKEQDLAKLDFQGKPYVFVLHHVVERPKAAWPQGSFQSWLYYMKVFIEDKLNRTFPDAITFQIEYNQILSLVFIDGEHELRHSLNEIKSVLDHDRESGAITIAVTSVYEHSGQFSEAYKEVKEMSLLRKLTDETQIVTSLPVGTATVAFPKEQLVQFRANLREGNADVLQGLLERHFSDFQDKDVPAVAWFRFAESVVDQLRITVSEIAGQAGADALPDKPEEHIAGCVTVHELETLLLDWTVRAADAVRAKSEAPKDPITSFVLDYVGDHLAEEIYLDALAEKLNLSSGYLSTYFKDKTGSNFIEYVNETRIRKASELLLNTRSKIQEVAEAVGYRNITSFNRMFKKYTGLSPSEYRKSEHNRPN
ncbi:helix-turn-helix domain-containing protein [Paenibacillus sp. strain BS8-2]